MMERMDMHALADGQLEGAAKQAAEAARDADPALRAEFDSISILKQALQSKAEPITCAETWQKCRGRLEELEKRKRVEGFVGRYAWGLCSVFFVAILGAAMFNRSNGDGLRTGDAARMLSSLAPISRNGGTASVEMRDWIRKTNSSPEIRLVGVAQGSYNGHPVAVYQLQDADGDLAALEIRGVNKVEGVEPMLENNRFSVGKLNNTNCVTWVEGSSTLFLVAERPYEELARVAEALTD